MSSIYIGLQNEGATCYLNSMLQSLFFTNEFRRIVHSISIDEENAEESFVFWLQSIFSQMEMRSPDDYNVRRFIETFGWTDTSHQQDIEEFSCQLISQLEEIVRGTPAHTELCALFSGEMIHTIRCEDGYESLQEETFWNLQLYIGSSDDILDAIVSSLKPTALDEYV